MKNSALGIIETLGFVPAVEAADTALKTASVEITGLRYLGAGLVSVIMTGDISSVKASVEAGKKAAELLGKIISTTVIGRPAEGMETILFDGKESPKKSRPKKLKPESAPGITQEKSFPGTDEQEKTAGTACQESSLEEMSVKKLRKLARTMEPFNIARKKIKFARKDELIGAIVDHYRQEED